MATGEASLLIRRRAIRALLLAASNALLILFPAAGVSAATTAVRLAWDANAEPDLAGYILHYGTAPGAHTASIDVGNVTSYRIDDLPEGNVHYFAAVAYDLERNMSAKSNEIAVVPQPVAPSLNISASAAPNPIAAGGILVYTLNYSNSGTAEATGVVIAAAVPVNTTFTWATGGGALSGSKVTWTAGGLQVGASGAVRMLVRVVSPLTNGTILVNGDYTIDSNETAPVAGATVQTTVTSAPILRVSKVRIPDVVRAGDFVTYRITYSNLGNATANGVVIIDVLPQNTSYVWATEGGSHQSGTGHWLTWSRGTLPPGSTDFVHEIVRVSSPLPVGSLITSEVLAIVSNETAPVFGVADVAIVAPPAPPRVGNAIDELTGSNSILAAGLHTVQIAGIGFQQGASVDLGPGIAVDATTWVSPNRLDVLIEVDPGAPRGPRRLSVTNPDLGTSSLAAALSVISSPDLNRDCRLDSYDFTGISGALDSARGEPRFNDVADLDGDGSVGPADLALFLTYMGKALPTCP